MSQQLLERVVKGPKSFWTNQPIMGQRGPRVEAKPGDTVSVTPKQAKAFAHNLIDPGVAAAMQQVAKAQAAAERAEAESKMPAPTPAGTPGVTITKGDDSDDDDDGDDED